MPSIRESEELFRFEMLLTDLVARFVNVAPDQVGTEIGDAQRRVCECLGLDLSALWEWKSDRPNCLILTHLYRPLGGPPTPEIMEASEYFPWCLNKLAACETVVVSSMEDAPPEAARDVQAWRHYGIKTTLTIPLSAGNDPPFGAISFNHMRTERKWSGPLVKRLELVAKVFSNAIVRKRSEQALRESEEQLSMALEAAGAGAWSLDAKTKQVWVSAGERRLFGFAADESLTQDSFMDRIHPDDRDSVRTAVERALRTETPFFVEYRIVQPDGGVRWISARGNPRYTTRAEPERLMGVSVDITDRKKREELLRSSEARIASAADVAGLGFYELDENTRVNFLDERIRTLFGVTPAEEARGWDYWLSHIHPEDLPEVLRLSHKILEEGLDRHVVEYRYIHPSHGLVWLQHLTRVLERSAAGRAIRLACVVRDITERKEAEAALEESRTQITAVMNSTNDLIWSVDPERFGLLTWNRAFRDYFFEQRDIEIKVGMTPSELVPPEYVLRWHELFSRAVRDGSAVAEYVVVAGTRTLHLALHSMQREGKLFGISVFGRDITELKNAERKLKQMSDEIAHLTRVTTMGELTAALAHELNQPLAAIMNNANAASRMVRSGKPDLSVFREIVEDIIADGTRAGEIVRRVRSFVQKSEPVLQSLDVNDVIREVARLVQSDASIKSVTVNLDLSGSLPTIRSDRVQLQQVLLNLIVNAFDAMGDIQGERQLTVNTTCPPGGGVSVTVQDSGPGIPQEKVDSVFDPFYSSKPGGLGMGLTICRTIVASLGGRIWAANAAKGGAIFRFDLPAPEDQNG